MNDRPLFFGRILRVLAGVALLVWLEIVQPQSFFWRGVLVFFGVSFIVGGVMAYAGCEICALPNLLLHERLHCF